MAELSLAARAVLNAYRADWRDEQLNQDVKCLAAALRAAADRVVPYDARMTFDLCSHELDRVRGEFLAIATELESAQ